MFNPTPSTPKGHFRNYPLTGHIVDMAQTTRLTHSGHPWLNETIGARSRGPSSMQCCPKAEAALKMYPADIADPAYLQNCGFLITGARSLTPAKSIDVPLNPTFSSQHP